MVMAESARLKMGQRSKENPDRRTIPKLSGGKLISGKLKSKKSITCPNLNRSTKLPKAPPKTNARPVRTKVW